MVRAAPRYDPRIREAIVELDDPKLPIAEIGRRVGARADELGLTRPSLVYLRELVADERERKALEADLLRIVWDAYRTVNFGRRLDPSELEARIRNAGQKPASN